jgi:hypothetical protein
MSSLDSQRHNRVRQLILRIASPVYPNALDAQLLRATLGTLGYPMSDHDLGFYLAYLKEKGYVRLDDKPEFGICLVTITAQGIDVMDGRIKDACIGCEGL